VLLSLALEISCLVFVDDVAPVVAIALEGVVLSLVAAALATALGAPLAVVVAITLEGAVVSLVAAALATALGAAHDAVFGADLFTAFAAVVIDDFGTGASNIANLRIFPYSELKIDQSFINNIQTDAFSAETVRSSISLARQLDMRIVAEGVENKQVLEVIKAKGIDEAQGYHISSPIPAEDLNYFFENAHTWMAGKNALKAKQRSSKVA